MKNATSCNFFKTWNLRFFAQKTISISRPLKRRVTRPRAREHPLCIVCGQKFSVRKVRNPGGLLSWCDPVCLGHDRTQGQVAGPVGCQEEGAAAKGRRRLGKERKKKPPPPSKKGNFLSCSFADAPQEGTSSGSEATGGETTTPTATPTTETSSGDSPGPTQSAGE